MGDSSRSRSMFSLPVVRGYLRFIGIAFRASPPMALAAIILTVISALAPLGGVAALSMAIGQVPAVIRHGTGSPAGHLAFTLIALLAVLTVAQSAAATAQTACATALADRVDFALQRKLMSAVMAPAGIGHLEDPQTQDLIAVGKETFRAWLRPGRLAISLSTLASSRFLQIGSCLVLAAFYRWPLALALLASVLWAEDENRRASRQAAEHHHGRSPLARRTDYFYETGVTPAAAKEIRVFGLPDFMIGRFCETWKMAMTDALGKGSRRALASTVVLAAVTVAAITWICVDAVNRTVVLGMAILFAQAIMVCLGSVSTSATNRLESEMALSTLGRFETALRAAGLPRLAALTGSSPAAGLPRHDIRFERVSFRYPGAAKDALHELSLTIPAGRSLAIVGANGAGKTTLVKLLCRLYEPDAGRILADGQDLAELDAGGWRSRFAAVFQDYVRYDLPVRTNIGFGYVAAQDDLAGIQAAAGDAGVSEAIGKLSHGWDSVLSTSYESGGDLSGGEWQKVALARALFAMRHGAGILILDEPAANLDARAEAQLYERFLALTEGVTTIVISHRFSTVRQAAQIAVIRDGRVAELGSHRELLALDGHYAHMFRLQAARFSEPVLTEGGRKP